jgi:protein-S-isoprenylcysteine O-methyltransferase Ste14
MDIAKGRVGTFFLVIGLIMLVVFFVTDQSQNPEIFLFLGGLLVSFIGVLLIWKDWKPREPANRFRLMRRMRKKKEDKPEENRG